MSARAKDNKVASAIKKLFKSPDKKKETDAHNNNNNNGPSGSDSPARRLKRGVSPAGATSRHGATVAPMKVPHPPMDNTIRARRLLKEFKEIKKIQSASPNPYFSVPHDEG